jgi:glycosyltransferase involved in cell wall biosynthesis
MRIGINGLLLSSEAGYRQSGIDRYIRGLLSELPDAMPGDHLTVYAEAGAVDPTERFDLHSVPAFTSNRALRIAWEQAGLPRAIRKDRCDVFHGTAFALPSRLPAPGVVTIHDLAFWRWPDQVPKRRGIYLARAVVAAVKKATRVIAVSEATKADVVELLRVEPDRIDVTPLGVDPRFQRPCGEEIVAFRQRNDLSHPFILAVGTREPRKNLPELVRAFAQISDDIPHDLVHAGGDGWLTDELDEAVAEANLGDRLRFVDFVPHDELPLWYSAADCFVMPSLAEGFGLPLLEAMACGTPSIASDRSSLPEVAGEGAYLCETDADSIASALTTVLHDGELRQRLHEAGPVRAAQFTWRRTAELTAESYRRAASDG